MVSVRAGDVSRTKEATLSKLAPVLALKSAALQPTSNFQTLKKEEQQQVWAVFADVLPTILAQCSVLSALASQRILTMEKFHFASCFGIFKTGEKFAFLSTSLVALI